MPMIRHDGDIAEELFLKIVSISKDTVSAKVGDAQVTIEGKDYPLEIKKCTSDTINQIRAIKFLPLIVYSPQLDLPWFVLPPQLIIELVSKKSRGQHSEIPFECATLSLTNILKSKAINCSNKDLENSVISAIKSEEKYTELKATMESLHSQLVALNSATKQSVKNILGKE